MPLVEVARCDHERARATMPRVRREHERDEARRAQ
jgi:hypothetical protein